MWSPVPFPTRIVLISKTFFGGRGGEGEEIRIWAYSWGKKKKKHGVPYIRVDLRTYVSLGESLHGYRICIQAILQDKPKIVTSNLGKVSPRWCWDTRG